MTVEAHPDALKITRSDGLEVDLAPLQGLWTEQQYLRLTEQTNHLIEFTDGCIEVLPMPTSRHQTILLLLYERLKAAVQSTGGKVLVAPLRLRLRPGKFREPDILLLRSADDPRYQDAFWLGADLVVEVVSPDRPERDTEEKVRDYAEAGIPEYWIVNPLDETVTVLTLAGEAYTLHGVFRRGQRALSKLLDGFGVAVNEIFDAQ
ncbi:MAG: Uma2 family endonuclease [Roseiflexaceae bacterium]|nr:Uma2 family endonuclease [Roseiflexus sp.]MDW8213837.1 Uma2 family endonuclease [Roseiflexaceae bacterium]